MSSALIYLVSTGSAAGEPGAEAPPGVTKTDVRATGLYGALYAPAGARGLPLIIAISGSDGGLDTASRMGRAFSNHGYAVLALAYWRAPGLPPAMENIPLEYFKRAIDWAKVRPEVDPDRIGLVGASRGAERALLIAAHDADIKAVLAVAPSSHVWPASSMNLSAGADGATVRKPAWTPGGQPIAFLSPVGSGARAVFAAGLADASRHPDAEIPVERINGAVLLLSGDDDDIWPAGPMAERIVPG